MQILPAGIAIFIAELCCGLVMLGIHRFAPGDKCTRYWGIGMLLTGAGILVVTENAGELNYAKLMLGNCGIILGGIYSWWGMQLFYQRRASRAGRVLAVIFILAFALGLMLDASVAQRSLLVSCFVLVMVIVWLREIERGHRHRHTFASRLALGATCGLLLIYALRVLLLLGGLQTSMTRTPDVMQVALVYFAPLACLLLCGAGLMLMYFERIIAENRRMASEDALTGLLNRGAITAAGERAVAHALQHHVPLTVAMLDIDFFKNINDSLGHDAGDQVLVDVARLLSAHCRQQDMVSRYGGEEFCILFPDMDQAASVGAAERILKAVRAYRNRQDCQLTVSIGIAVLARHESAAVTWVELVKAADQQLYLAKRNGRDQCRCVIFPAEQEQAGAAPRAVCSG